MGRAGHEGVNLRRGYKPRRSRSPEVDPRRSPRGYRTAEWRASGESCTPWEFREKSSQRCDQLSLPCSASTALSVSCLRDFFASSFSSFGSVWRRPIPKNLCVLKSQDLWMMQPSLRFCCPEIVHGTRSG